MILILINRVIYLRSTSNLRCPNCDRLYRTAGFLKKKKKKLALIYVNEASRLRYPMEVKMFSGLMDECLCVLTFYEYILYLFLSNVLFLNVLFNSYF